MPQQPAPSHDSSSETDVELDNLPPAAEKVPPAASDLPSVDVGLKPWLQVLGGFFLMFNTWGLVVAFGSFQVRI